LGYVLNSGPLKTHSAKKPRLQRKATKNKIKAAYIKFLYHPLDWSAIFLAQTMKDSSARRATFPIICIHLYPTAIYVCYEPVHKASGPQKFFCFLTAAGSFVVFPTSKIHFSIFRMLLFYWWSHYETTSKGCCALPMYWLVEGTLSLPAGKSLPFTTGNKYLK